MLGRMKKITPLHLLFRRIPKAFTLIARQAFSPTREPGMEAPYTELVILKV
jgi:hypothetical protein